MPTANHLNTLTGVVLCGGHSTRMGQDKGLLRHGSRTWAAAAAEKLAGLSLPVVFSINKSQLSLYANHFHTGQLIVDEASFPVSGPLLGLLSVHARFSQRDLLVLACDMKDMTPTLLEDLRRQSAQTDSEAIVYQVAEKIQPLCGIYKVEGLKKIAGLVGQGGLKRSSMMEALTALHTTNIHPGKEDESAFNNYNRPGDL